MKTIKTGFGVKKIEDCEEGVLILQLREFLSAHRAKLIQRLVTDLPMYIEYKFNIKADKKQLVDIRERLDTLKNASIDLDKYNAAIQDVLRQDVTYLVNESFYQEFNDCIGWYLHESQLILVK